MGCSESLMLIDHEASDFMVALPIQDVLLWNSKVSMNDRHWWCKSYPAIGNSLKWIVWSGVAGKFPKNKERQIKKNHVFLCASCLIKRREWNGTTNATHPPALPFDSFWFPFLFVFFFLFFHLCICVFSSPNVCNTSICL